MLSLTLKPQRRDSGPFTVPPHPDRGTIEEEKTLGVLEVLANRRCLTAGLALESDALLPGPRVSGYHIAEWLAWNWWRLRWEARPSTNLGHEWFFSHCLSSIGEGYVWPNIVISSDGVRAIVTSAPTADPAAGLYRYVGAPTSEVVAATELETAIDSFARYMLDLLDSERVDTNLHRIWHDLETEQQDGRATQLRRLEARLGKDPDEIPPEQIRSAIDAALDMGPDAVDELAADAGACGTAAILSTKELVATAKDVGSDARPQDAVELHAHHYPYVHAGNMQPWAFDMQAWAFGEVAAWRVGVNAAHALRQQEALGMEPIDNERLSALAGTSATVLDREDLRPSPLSFMLAMGEHARVALRSKWETGRRFDLARLLGDRLLGQDEPLLPATRAYTYRQKAQRAFAAELLCPYEAICEFLDRDRSTERCDEAAGHFNVSPLAISSLLQNNDHLHASTKGGASLHSEVW